MAIPIPAEFDVASITAQVDAVLQDALTWFPVRHHSPTVARHLAAAIARRKPRLIFIEGPHEANHLIDFLVDPKTDPPVAIYSSFRDDDNSLGLNGIRSPAPDIPMRSAIWYPLTSYSPELVALKAAKNINAEAIFIDLPHYALLEEEPSGSPGPSTDESIIRTSRFYQQLAASAGFKTWDEAWDTLFENPHSTDDEAFRRELATFCCAVRATSDPDSLEMSGTIARERHFLRVIRDTLQSSGIPPEQALVVCGGFHLFLDRSDHEPPPACPPGAVYTTIVPYSFFRISEMGGYRAGNRAPQFYETCFKLVTAGRADDIAMEHSIAVLRQIRKEGEPLSTADAIAITHHARMLSQLRGKSHTTYDDIDDALITCCCKGNPGEEGLKLRKAIDTASIGTRIGKVTPRLGRLPLVNDFHNQLADLELGEVLGKEKQLRLRLDKRVLLDSRRAAFLRRVDFLKFPFAVLRATGNEPSHNLFREDWEMKWSPKIEPALIEFNLYGDTVESAASNQLCEVIAGVGNRAGSACGHLLRAIDMDLPNLVQLAETAAGRAIDADPAFASLAEALQHLVILQSHSSFHQQRSERLDELLTRCYDRACFALPGAASVPEEEQPGVVQGLVTLAEILQRADVERYDRVLFAEATRRAANESEVPFLCGAFLGLLCEIREIPADTLASEIGGLAGATAELMITAGDLLDGMFAVSRTSILLGADALIAAVDDLLKAAEWEAFLVMLPRLRGAFERLSNAQRDSLASTVAQRYGLTSAASVRRVMTSLTATARVARIDAAVAAALKDWTL